MKKCPKCDEKKDLIYFHLNKTARDGRYAYCKTCRKQDGTVKEKNRIYYQQTKQKRRIYKENNREQIQRSNAEWYKKNKKKLNARSSVYQLNKRRSNPTFRLICNLRTRLRKAIKRIKAKKHKSTKEFLGCSIEAFKIHLENKFSTGMSWDNYGEWHLDHIKPCCSFDLTDIKQQKVCFHYTNLQPLWAIDNLKKGRKVLMSQNGKGSKKRPSLVSYEMWEKNWNQIFKPQLPKKEPNHGSGRKSSH